MRATTRDQIEIENWMIYTDEEMAEGDPGMESLYKPTSGEGPAITTVGATGAGDGLLH